MKPKRAINSYKTKTGSHITSGIVPKRHSSTIFTSSVDTLVFAIRYSTKCIFRRSSTCSSNSNYFAVWYLIYNFSDQTSNINNRNWNVFECSRKWRWEWRESDDVRCRGRRVGGGDDTTEGHTLLECASTRLYTGYNHARYQISHLRHQAHM